MHPHVYHNDRVLPLAEARLSPGQAGLFNGWGIFTTLLLRRGRPFAFDRHWRRLSRDAKLIGLPFGFAPGDVRQALMATIGANRVDHGCARLYFVHNKVGIWHGDEDLPDTDLVITTRDVPDHHSPAVLGVRPHGRHAAHTLTGAKVISWLDNVWMLRQAHQAGYDEVILLNERGEVAECTAANVFAMHGEWIATPPLSSGCLPGVTREVLLELGRDIGLAMREESLTLADLHDAEEVFITSSTRGVLPVKRIADEDVPRVLGSAVQRLAAAFNEYVDRECGGSAEGA